MNNASRPRIGLALSGGGARAMAFHLGCLRALNQLGLLESVEVLSTVSGGSVIGACLQAHSGDFTAFEAKMRKVLATGLVAPMRRRLFGLTGFKLICSSAIVGAVAICISLIRLLAWILQPLLPASLASHFERLELRSPLHRFASRTTLLEAALDDLLFSGLALNSLPASPHLVINATELRTGSAFRFGTLESGSWRWGKLYRNEVSVAHAVAASAAYPLYLPAFDETLVFEKNGTLQPARVSLTDGGVYDNLGLGCLWPDRTPDVSLNVIPIDTIICCSAGYGLRQDPPTQFFFARMMSVFSTVFDRAQNAAMHRLHGARQQGAIKSFIMPYLGQQDRNLPDPPAGLVRREETHFYPTDFNAMPAEWIDRLSRRGEQLTLCLATAYLQQAGTVSAEPEPSHSAASASAASATR